MNINLIIRNQRLLIHTIEQSQFLKFYLIIGGY